MEADEALELIASVQGGTGPWGTRRAVVQLVRAALSRWGPTLRSDLRRYLSELWSGLGRDLADSGESDPLRVALEHMELLGEVIVLRSTIGVLVVPCPAVAIRVADRRALLGVPEVADAWPVGTVAAISHERLPAAHVHWLDDVGWDGPDRDLVDWLASPLPATLLPAGAISDLTTISSARRTLTRAWEHLVAGLDSPSAGPLSRTTEFVVLAGAPGETIGDSRQAAATTRWRRPLDCVADGVWLACRPVVGDRQRPGLVRINGGTATRWIDLGSDDRSSWDLLRWGLLARGVAEGLQEQCSVQGSVLTCRAPLPTRLRVMLDALSMRAHHHRGSRDLGTSDAATACASALAFAGVEMV